MYLRKLDLACKKPFFNAMSNRVGLERQRCCDRDELRNRGYNLIPKDQKR
jgi:hypothetical protein